ncbi:MAG: T9SS type A sorting domain-containing protein [Saprospiraceae bacterium]|uniref:T9SS type A sorting domain-containing protein n=1 Tax=Candidatus Opimibacter skivensis TaxID=2982028 RepID=A0A9D7SZI2_9BACT|nr:T9SS type A sorting domain-containing protein [Candidatus Opimibacter skivensis]
MIKNLLSILSFLFVVAYAEAQTTILDFETAGTSTTFQYFGSGLDGSLNQIIPNPDASGEDTSSMVASFTKPAVAEVWAGAFSNPNPGIPVDLTLSSKVSIKVWMDHIGSLSLKLENSTDGGSNWVTTVANTQVNTWETLVFDATALSIEAPNAAAAGHTYATVTLFFDFGNPGTGTDVTSYLDDIIVLPPAPVFTSILDFETPATGTVFQYFGSPLDGTFTEILANPDPSGIDTSDNVTHFIKPAVAEVWAGAFSNPNPTTPVTLDAGSQVCIKVWMDHIGNLALKLENGAGGQANWITTVANTTINQWEEICFDISAPSIEAPFEPATGTYNTITLFFDFGTAGNGTDINYYFDDIGVKSIGAPQARNVHFKIDMNQYAQNFDQVYLSGTFNNWSGDANPLADPEFDGVWEGDLQLTNGSYEYKVTLDNWAGQEQFQGFEECTKKDPSGQFVNRLLLVSGDTELPQFCFNSCYACGQERSITFRIGMYTFTPSPDGVWLAGGGNFDVPGGKYKMQDDDGDGIYEITVPREVGFSSYYDFANGACPDYSCKEDLSGQSCGDPNNYNDRFLSAVQTDTIIETCFGTCFIDAACTVGTINPTQDEHVFSLYGNPSINGQSVLEFGDQVKGEKVVSLTNTLGQNIRNWRVDEGITTQHMSTAGLPSGLYFVTVTAGNRFYTRKLTR